MVLALIVLVVGGLIYLLFNGRPAPPNSRLESNLAELGKWAFIIGLAAYFLSLIK